MKQQRQVVIFYIAADLTLPPATGLKGERQWPQHPSLKLWSTLFFVGYLKTRAVTNCKIVRWAELSTPGFLIRSVN